MTSNLTPLLQLNLFIHMGLDYVASDSSINPYLRKLGYKIKYISYPIPLKTEMYRKLTSTLRKNVNKTVVPEIIYENEDNGELLLLECKVTGFTSSLEYHGAQQAMGYLSLSPAYLDGYFGLRSNHPAARLLYAVDNNDKYELGETLNQLSQNVSKVLGKAMSHEIYGMSLTEDGAFIYTDSETAAIRIADGSVTNNVVVLYLVPVDPEMNLTDRFGREVLEQQVRSAVISKVGRLLGVKSFEFTSTDICKDIIPVWDVWAPKSRKSVRRLVRTFITTIQGELAKKGLTIEYIDNKFIVPKVDYKVAERIRAYFKSSDIEGVGQEAFDQINRYEQLEMDEFLDEEEIGKDT
ncbi:hypothetical protein [Brevibacillus porteri]|uniref:hypothetical protein n=1 Tax=Brevibacillus porteri TaxID=2126350 RepID=UPI003D2498A9